jgi:hypothetical protein
MLRGDYYHGTSSERLKEIKSEGFKLRGDWSKWLCAKGIYFVFNRPIVAYYYAKLATLIDFERKGIDSTPVVIKVPLNILDSHKILNLTTDSGMLEFYKKYSETKMMYEGKSSFLDINDKFINDLRSKTFEDISSEEIEDYIESMTNKKRSYSQFKWDCAVITELVNNRDYSAVLAVFQEGDSMAYDFYKHIYEDEHVPSYQGIRYRDAIIACVTDLSMIDSNPNTYEIIVLDEKKFPVEFIKKGASVKKDFL